MNQVRERWIQFEKAFRWGIYAILIVFMTLFYVTKNWAFLFYYLFPLLVTESGTKHNYKTKIPVTDIEAVKKIMKNSMSSTTTRILHFLDTGMGKADLLRDLKLTPIVQFYTR